MIVGILQVELSMEWAQSLKDKRRVVASVKDTLHRHHMVSVAEIDSLDDMHTAVLGIAMAATDINHCQSVLDRILDKLAVHPDCVLEDHSKEILTGK